jgi:uncharacterized protein YgiB involved in biofilm formation
LDGDDDICRHPKKNDDSMYATFAARANKKSKKTKCTTAWENAPAEDFFVYHHQFNWTQNWKHFSQ